MPVVVYGIPNCDSIKKARAWLEQQGIDYHFHNFRKDGLDPEQLDRWIQDLTWQTLLNKRGMKWRALPESDKNSLDASSAREIMLAEPAIIKRPVLDTGQQLLVGFDPDTWHSELQ